MNTAGSNPIGPHSNEAVSVGAIPVPTLKIPADLDLLKRLHSALPEPLTQKDTQTKDLATPSLQISGGEQAPTQRYDLLFNTRHAQEYCPIPIAHLSRHSGLHLQLERGLAEIADRLVGLNGRKVIALESGPYPFFAASCAKKGAEVEVTGPRIINQVIQHLFRGTLAYDLEKAELSNLRVEAARRNVALHEKLLNELKQLSPYQQLSEVVASNFSMPNEVWDKLIPRERDQYICQWILDNPSLRNHLGVITGGRDYLVKGQEAYPFLLNALRENFVGLIKEDLESLARRKCYQRVVASQDIQSQFSATIAAMGLKIIPTFGDAQHSDDIATSVRSCILQTHSKQEQLDIARKLKFHAGKNLGEIYLESNSTDVVFSGRSLEKIENLKDFTDNAARVLKPDGVFLGYLHATTSSPTWNSCTDAASIRKLLTSSGFRDPVIVQHDNGPDNANPTILVFFARKSEEASLPIKEAPHIEEFSHSRIFSGQVAQVSTIIEKPKTEQPNYARCDQNSNFQACTDFLLKSPADCRALSKSVFGFEIAKGSPDDVENILRAWWVTSNNQLSDSLGLTSSMSRVLTQFLARQTQVQCLIQDLSSLVTAINQSEQTEIITAMIRHRAQILGIEEVSACADALVSLGRNFELPSESNSAYQTSREKLRQKLLGDRIPLHTIENDLLEHKFTWILQDRRRVLAAVEAQLVPILGKNGYAAIFHLANDSVIRTNIGKIHKIEQWTYQNATHPVIVCDLSISNTYGFGGLQRGGDTNRLGRRYVFLDAVAKIAEDHLRKVEQNSPLSPLERRQWGATVDRNEMYVKLSTTISIHELQHGYGMDELGSFLAETAFGPTPWYSLHSQAEFLRPHSKTDHSQIENGIGTYSYRAAALELVPRDLTYLLKKNRLPQVLHEKVSKLDTASNGEAPFATTIWDHAKISIVKEAYTYLTDDEIRRRSLEHLTHLFKGKSPEKPAEITNAVPLVITPLQIANQGQPSNPRVLDLAKSTGGSIANSLAFALEFTNETNRSVYLSNLAEILIQTDLPFAKKVLDCISDRVTKEQCLISCAQILVRDNKKEDAHLLLSDAELLIDRAREELAPHFGPYSDLGDRILFEREILYLYMGLAQQDKAVNFIQKLEFSSAEAPEIELTSDLISTVCRRAMVLHSCSKATMSIAMLERYSSRVSQAAGSLPNAAELQQQISAARIRLGGEMTRAAIDSYMKLAPNDLGFLIQVASPDLPDIVMKVRENLEVRLKLEKVSVEEKFAQYIHLGLALWRANLKDEAFRSWRVADDTLRNSSMTSSHRDFCYRRFSNLLADGAGLPEHAAPFISLIEDTQSRSFAYAQVARVAIGQKSFALGLSYFKKARDYTSVAYEQTLLDVQIEKVTSFTELSTKMN